MCFELGGIYVRLTESIIEVREGKKEGFEDIFFLTYKSLYKELNTIYNYDKDIIWEIISKTYIELWNKKEEIPDDKLEDWLISLAKNIIEDKSFENKEYVVDLKKVTDLDKQAETLLISIEDELGFFNLEESTDLEESLEENFFETKIVSRMKKSSNQLIVKTVIVGILIIIAGILTFSLIDSKDKIVNKKETTKITETTTSYGVVVETTSENAENAEKASFGWNKYEKGWKYKKSDGSFVLENWLFDDAKLYYFNELGYMVKGDLHLGAQDFEFADSGELKSITRKVYDIEQNETDLGRQLDQQGMGDLKIYIINDSIVNEDGWIYYLSKEENKDLPSFCRLKDGTGKIEMISEGVNGYVVVEDTAWYFKDDKLIYFVTANQAAVVGENAMVTDSNGRYILTDANEKQVSFKENESIQIGARIYNLENGAIVSVDQIPTVIGKTTYILSGNENDNNIYTDDGEKYLSQGKWITGMCVVGNELYYSTIVKQEGDIPFSQLYKINVNTKERVALTSQFEGRVTKMYYYPENASIFMEYYPLALNNTYGRVLDYNLSENKLYLILDEAERGVKGASALSRLRVVTTEGKDLYCYIEEGIYNEQTKDMQVSSMSTVTLNTDSKVQIGAK